MQVYLNPTDGILTIETNDSRLKQISVVDNLGRIILELSTTNSSLNIDLSQFNSGIYFVNIQSSIGTEVSKIVKY